MKEAMPEYRSLLLCLGAGSPVWCQSSIRPQRSRPLPCTSQYVQGIGGLLVEFRTILERGGAVLCIGTKAVVAGTMAELGVSGVAPSLRRDVGGTGA